MAVMLVTSVGELVIDLFTDQCPLATKNFLKLCKIKYYNNCLFHSVQKDFIVQTGDPTGTGKGGDSVYKLLYGDQARFFADEIHPTLRHDKKGIVAMASAGQDANASQFYITTKAELDYLDEKHTVFGEIGEGLDSLTRISEAIVDENHRPYKNIRIKHTVIIEDPFDDPVGLSDLIPDKSPELNPEAEGVEVRLEDDWDPTAETIDPEEMEKAIRKKEAESRAVVLEMIGDLPEADMKPPENVLFVCKLNPVTEEGDLEIIFGRFGSVKSADIIRDFKTGDSLCYAFVEFETEAACEAAYFKMDNVLIDDRRIHVDFSQSVSHLWNRYRKQGKAGGDGQSGKGCFKCGEVGHFAKECPNDGAEQKEGLPEKPKYTIKDFGGQRGNTNKRYEMVFADDENLEDQRLSDSPRQGRRQDKDKDSRRESEHHSRMERELERPRDRSRRSEREPERSRVDRDVTRDRNSERYRNTDSRTDRDFDNKVQGERGTDRRTERESEKPRRRTDREFDRDVDRRKESRREYSPEPRVERAAGRLAKGQARSPSIHRKEEERSRGRDYPDEVKESFGHGEVSNRRRDWERDSSRHDSERREKRSRRYGDRDVEPEPRGRKFEAAQDDYGEKRMREREASQDSAGDLHKSTGRSGKGASTMSHERDDYGRRERGDGRYYKEDDRSKKRRS